MESLFLDHKKQERERRFAVKYHKVSPPVLGGVSEAVVRRTATVLKPTVPESSAPSQVRFFERVKLERQIKQAAAQALHLADPSQQAAAAQRLKALEDDLQVTGVDCSLPSSVLLAVL